MISSLSSGSPPGMAAMAAMRSQKFSQADGDASGGLNATEFQNLVAQGPGKPASDTSSVEEDFKAFDTDADGSLTQAELEAGFEQKMLAFRSTVATYGGEGDTTHVDAAQGAGGPEGAHGPGGPHGPPPGPPPTEEASDSSTETEEEDPLQTLLAALQASVDEASTSGTASTTSTGNASSTARVANELRELLRGLMAEAAGSAGSASASSAVSLTA